MNTSLNLPEIAEFQGEMLQEHAAAVAAAFRQARLRRAALPGFPGIVPSSLQAAYAIQDAAIGAWPDTIVGWKVGRITGAAEDQFGVNRLIGPIFSHQHWNAEEITNFSAIVGGFCAVEAEYVFRLAQDSPTQEADIDAAAALHLVETLLIGVEIAGSPLATINQLGPTVVISDFGNNTGLISGTPVADWRNRLETLTASVRIDGVDVGSGTVASFPGGITESLVFALKTAARRGMPLKAGMVVSTGAVSGVHDIVPGQSAIADFGSDGIIRCHCNAALPDLR